MATKNKKDENIADVVNDKAVDDNVTAENITDEAPADDIAGASPDADGLSTDESKDVNINDMADTPIVEKPSLDNWVYNKDGKTSVRNITNIGISVIYENTTGRRGEVFIPPKQARPINNEEIVIKVESQNPSFCGTDGTGTNASLYIEDEGFRRYVGFENGTERQHVLSDTVLDNIYKTDKLADFKRMVEKSVKTYTEKDKLVAFLREKYSKGIFDSASKIDFVESYTGLKIRE